MAWRSQDANLYFWLWKMEKLMLQKCNMCLVELYLRYRCFVEGLSKKHTSGFCVSSFLARNDNNGDFCTTLSLREFVWSTLGQT